MKTGAKAFLTGYDFNRNVETAEAVTVAPIRKHMLPLPVGYIPVRFADGGVLMAPSSRLRAA